MCTISTKKMWMWNRGQHPTSVEVGRQRCGALHRELRPPGLRHKTSLVQLAPRSFFSSRSIPPPMVLEAMPDQPGCLEGQEVSKLQPVLSELQTPLGWLCVDQRLSHRKWIIFLKPHFLAQKLQKFI